MLGKRFGRANRTVHLVSHARFAGDLSNEYITSDGKEDAWFAAQKLNDAHLTGKLVFFSAKIPRAVQTAEILAELTKSAPPHASGVLWRASQFPDGVRRMNHLVRHLMLEAEVVEPGLQPVLVTNQQLLARFAGRTTLDPVEHGEVVSGNMRTWRNEHYNEFVEAGRLPELSPGAPRT